MPLVKRGNSKYWYVQFQIDHRTIVKSTKTTDRKAAQKIELKMRSDFHSGLLLGEKKKATFIQALDRFVESKTGTAGYKNLICLRRRVLQIISGNIPLRLIDSEQLQKLKNTLSERGLAPQTIKHHINIVMGAIRLAKLEKFETSDVQPPTIKIPQGKNRFLSKDEELRLLSELDPDRDAKGFTYLKRPSNERRKNRQDNYDLVVLLLDTGARYSEIANIKWDQIDLDTLSINLWRSKVSNESVLLMSDRSFEILNRRKQHKASDYVFTNKQGGPRGYRAVAIRRALNRAGLRDCTIHTFRHTHASRLVQMGMSIYEVQKILGHSDIKTTMRYAHLEEITVSGKARDLINALNQR